VTVTECIEWEWTRSKAGYGQTYWDGKREYAHRAVWMMLYGPIPPKHVVRHRCDNPPCINPDHLILGTQADNMQDCTSRGRLHMSLTHARCGHPYDGRDSRGARICTECTRKRKHEWYRSHR
jgi:hypothetical protein